MRCWAHLRRNLWQFESPYFHQNIWSVCSDVTSFGCQNEWQNEWTSNLQINWSDWTICGFPTKEIEKFGSRNVVIDCLVACPTFIGDRVFRLSSFSMFLSHGNLYCALYTPRGFYDAFVSGNMFNCNSRYGSVFTYCNCD